MLLRSLSCWGRELLFPAGCACCGKNLVGFAEAFWGVCDECAGSMIPDPGPRCLRCGRPLVSEKIVCCECREAEPPSHRDALALFRYSGNPRRLLHSYKFGAGRAAGTFIARLLAQAIQERVEEIGQPFAVVPVPPRPGKIRRVGWDQVSAIVDKMARFEGLPVKRCLRRLPSKTQKELGRDERIRNLRGRIVCVSAPPERAVLVDDVLTTGATAAACGAALVEAGCGSVFVLTFCYD